MRRLLLPALMVLLGYARPAHAQEDLRDDDQKKVTHEDGRDDDDADERKSRRNAKKVRRESHTVEEELYDDEQGPKRMSRLDDPRLGVGIELMGSMALLHNASGGFDASPAIGVRGSWSPFRPFAEAEDEFWKDAVRVELGYDGTGSSQGTTAVQTQAQSHLIQARGLIGLPVKQLLLAYADVGTGMAILHSRYTVLGTQTGLTAVKPVLAAGLGVRVDARIGDQLGICGRFEVEGIRRGDQNDVWLTLGAGLSF